MKKMYVVEDWRIGSSGGDLIEEYYFEQCDLEKALESYRSLQRHCEVEPISRLNKEMGVQLWFAEVVEEDGCRWPENHIDLIKECKKTSKEMIGFDD